MKKKVIIFLSVVAILVIGAYLYLRFFLLKAHDFKPDQSKAQTPLDLRPSIIAKLQQLVKDGSDGLYRLSIENLDPHVLTSQLDVFKIALNVDSARMKLLDEQKKLPDDIFKVTVDSLHIDGLGIDYLLHSKTIDVTAIDIVKPFIEVHHVPKPYNQDVRDHANHTSLYGLIKEQVHSISIRGISMRSGQLVIYDGPTHRNITRLNDLGISISDLLVDSTTQYDKDRFLFAKRFDVSAKDYITATADSLYYFKTQRLNFSAEKKQAILQHVMLIPRGSREEFAAKTPYSETMMEMDFETVRLYGVDWWRIVDRDEFVAEKGEIIGGKFSAFVDKRKPSDPHIVIDNFPHQKLMDVKIPVAVDHLSIKDVQLVFASYNPESDETGSVYFDKINGTVDHISNMPEKIGRHPVTNFSVNTLFMHRVPTKISINFDMAHQKTGAFNMDVEMAGLENETINDPAKALGMFYVKTGKMQSGKIHIDGNNLSANANMAMLYNDLHIDPLKPAPDGGLKKRRVSSWIANIFFIKNENPFDGKIIRKPNYSVQRGTMGNFFRLIWITTLTGILKTLGMPEKLVIH